MRKLNNGVNFRDSLAILTLFFHVCRSCLFALVIISLFPSRFSIFEHYRVLIRVFPYFLAVSHVPGASCKSPSSGSVS